MSSGPSTTLRSIPAILVLISALAISTDIAAQGRGEIAPLPSASAFELVRDASAEAEEAFSSVRIDDLTPSKFSTQQPQSPPQPTSAAPPSKMTALSNEGIIGQDEANQVQWNPAWPKVRWWEYAVGGVGLLGGLSARAFHVPEPPNWTSGILFDDWVIDNFALRDRETRNSVLLISDITFYGTMAYRAFDAIVVPGLVHGNWEVAQQMAFIDLQAFGMAAGLLWGGQFFIKRQRPTVKNCDDPNIPASSCGEDSTSKNRSFFAGHTATVTTGAALTCLHHSRLPLYGEPWAGKLACGTMIGAAIVNGWTRAATEKHYASDVIIGWSVGTLVGYVIPATLHYGFGDTEDAAQAMRDAQDNSSSTTFRSTLAPMWTDGGAGLRWMGAF